MPHIHLETFIKAPIDVVFDLSRSVDLHTASMTHHREEIIDGVRTGLMEKGNTVTWRATHLFKSRTLKVQLTELVAPTYFADEMAEGDFKKMRHEHRFQTVTGGTVMRDNFYFQSPFGIFGRFADALFLKAYMARLLCERNAEIKRVAENNRYKEFLT